MTTPQARISVLVSSGQASALRAKAHELRMETLLDTAIDRKGTDVVALCWTKVE